MSTTPYPGFWSNSVNCLSIVAVHGLEEDGTDTWTDPETGCSWLRDLLPNEDFDARILTFDYQCDATSIFGSGSVDRILYHALTLVQELDAEREMDGSRERPIIFVCHGFGGIIVKRALSTSLASTGAKVSHLHSIFTSTFAIMFMGTPHEGIENVKPPLASKGLRGMFKERSNLYMSIEKNGEILGDITDQFIPLLSQFRIYNFWEMIETSFGGAKSFIVSPASAAPAWEDPEKSGIMATHAAMCKFQSRDTAAYRTIVATLKRYIKEAGYVVEHRWKGSRKRLEMLRRAEVNEILSFTIPQLKGIKTIRNQHFLVPHPVSSIYTGRDGLVSHIQKIFLSDTLPKQKRFVLYGLGGSGKTQLCLKYAHDNRDRYVHLIGLFAYVGSRKFRVSCLALLTRISDRYWGVFWVDASSPNTAEQSFSALGRLANMEGKFESGLHWLGNQERPWLLIIDCADDPGFEYSRYFPSGDRGHIVVTSRNPDCGVLATVGSEELKGLEHEDSVSLLLKSAGVEVADDGNRALASHISKVLGHLPLALIQAGASIRRKICSLEEYLESFDSYKKSMFEDNLWQGRESYRDTILTTFERSLEKIKDLKSNEATDAQEILHVLAFIHFDQVPASIFENAWNRFRTYDILHPSEVSPRSIWTMFWDFVAMSRWDRDLPSRIETIQLPQILMQDEPTWDKIRYRKALHILSSHSLIFSSVSPDYYSMHPMVHFWAQQRLPLSDQRLWAKVASRVIVASINRSAEESEIIYRRNLLPHIDSCLKCCSDGLQKSLEPNDKTMCQYAELASVYAENSRWKDAIELQEIVLKTRQRCLGEENSETFNAIEALVQSYWDAGQLEKALHLQSTFLDICLCKFGQYDPITLRVTDGLGRTCWLSSHISRAEHLGKKAVDGLKRLLGSDHPFTLRAIHNYSRTRAYLEFYEEALRMQLDCLEARSNRSGPTSYDADASEIMQDIGMNYLALGKDSAAESQISLVLETRKRVIGPEHAYTLSAINDLSKIRCAQRRFQDAMALIKPTRIISTRTLGEHHIVTFLTTFNLACIHTYLDNWEEADNLLSKLIEHEIRTLGPLHRDVLAAKLQLASVCKSMKNESKAESLILDVFEGLKKTIGPEHPRTLRVMNQLVTPE